MSQQGQTVQTIEDMPDDLPLVDLVMNRQHGVAQPAADDALGRLRRHATGRLGVELGRGANQVTVGLAAAVTGSVCFFHFALAIGLVVAAAIAAMIP